MSGHVSRLPDGGAALGGEAVPLVLAALYAFRARDGVDADRVTPVVRALELIVTEAHARRVEAAVSRMRPLTLGVAEGCAPSGWLSVEAARLALGGLSGERVRSLCRSRRLRATRVMDRGRLTWRICPESLAEYDEARRQAA